MNWRLGAGVLLVVAATAAPTGSAMRADCAGVAGNLLARANCGFVKSVAGWTAVPDATIAHLPATAGDPTSAAMKVTSSAQGSLSALSTCVPVKGATPYQFSARLRLVNGMPYFCALNVWQYSDLKCTAGQEPLGSHGRPPSQTWADVGGTAVTRADAKSAHVRTDCSGPGVFGIAWDDFVLAPTSGR